MRKWEEIFLGFLFHQIRVKFNSKKERKNWLKINLWFPSSYLLHPQFLCTIFQQKKKMTMTALHSKRRPLKWLLRVSTSFAFGTVAHAGWSSRKWSHGSCLIHSLNYSLHFVLLSIHSSWHSIITTWIRVLRKYLRLATM